MFCINGVLIKVDHSSARNVQEIKIAVTPLEVNETDFSGKCRICLSDHSKPDLFNLFSSNQFFEGITISTAIQECFGVSICKDANLPNCVCCHCASSILQAISFKKVILQGEATLKQKVVDAPASPIIIDQHEIIRTSSPPSVADNTSLIESYGCNRQSIVSEHNYSKELITNESINTSVESKKGRKVDLRKNTTQKSSRKSLLPVLDKWWIKSCGPPYECKLCSRNYGNYYSGFYQHVRSHFRVRVPCSLCGKKYTKDKIKLHMRSHTNEKPFACDQCPARFTVNANLKRHSSVHTGLRSFMCDICGKGFTQNSDMQTHRQRHLGTTEAICEFCGKVFATRTHYRNHILRFHNKKVKKTNESNENDSYKCKECEKAFCTLLALHQHSTTEHTQNGIYKCGICALDVRLNFVRKIHSFMHELQTTTSDNMTTTCKFCSSDFANKTNLEQHLLEHIKNPHQCKQCYKSFPKRGKLVLHVLQHTGARPHQCKECGKTFKTSSCLYQHKIIHSGKRPHLCHICHRRFATKHHLTSHMIGHTGEKKYVCQYCGRAFAANGNLTVHVRRHIGETPYYCEVCGKGFHESSGRKKHMRLKHRDETSSKELDTELNKENQ